VLVLVIGHVRARKQASVKTTGAFFQRLIAGALDFNPLHGSLFTTSNA
jgi:hypothetical protein